MCICCPTVSRVCRCWRDDTPGKTFECSGLVLDLQAYKALALRRVATPNKDSLAFLCMSFHLQREASLGRTQPADSVLAYWLSEPC